MLNTIYSNVWSPECCEVALKSADVLPLHVSDLLQRFAGGWGTVAELKVTHANIICHNTIHHCSLEIQL